MFNVAIGITWQTALTATGIFIVLRDLRALAISLGLVAITAVILKFNWYDKLEDYPADLGLTPSGRADEPVQPGHVERPPVAAAVAAH
jgi:hypothetical protein